MAFKEELLDSIRPDMRLDRDFFMKIYGYELTWPGFVGIALEKLENAGCSKAREYYSKFVGDYEQKREETLKNAAEWYRQQGPRGGKKVNESRKRQEIIDRYLMMNDEQLLKLWRKRMCQK